MPRPHSCLSREGVGACGRNGRACILNRGPATRAREEACPNFWGSAGRPASRRPYVRARSAVHRPRRLRIVASEAHGVLVLHQCTVRRTSPRPVWGNGRSSFRESVQGAPLILMSGWAEPELQPATAGCVLRRTKATAASVRFWTPSRRKASESWVFTVDGAISMRCAIWSFREALDHQSEHLCLARRQVVVEAIDVLAQRL